MLADTLGAQVHRQLTEREIERQDCVDNAIFNLIRNLNPAPVEIEWDMEIIGEVRDQIQEYLMQKCGIPRSEFYP